MNKSSSASTQSIYFTFALILIFLRFSLLHETIAFLTGLNTYLLYIFGPVALFGVIVSNGLKRAYREWPGWLWLAFAVWLLLAIPFSSWKGGSLALVMAYIRTNFIMFLVTAGLATRWTHCKSMLYAIAMGAIVNLGTAKFFIKASSGDRLTLQGVGLISNPNDLAAHLLFVLPFLLFIVLKPRIHLAFRFLFGAAIVVGVFQILRTGSRGAFIALAFTLMFILVQGPRALKFAVATAVPVVLVILILMLPSSTWQRLTSFSSDDSSSREAVESSEARKYLLKQSLIYTFQHPIFGIGPGQFMTYEGQEKKEQGLRGAWHETHNSYTAISSECGIPALLLYLAAVISTFRLLGSIRKKAKTYGQTEIIAAAFCLKVALFAYSIVTLFVNFGYLFYLPATSGLVVAMWYAVRRDQQFQLANRARQDVTVPSGAGIGPIFHPDSVRYFSHN
jgi:O-antigen ligase